MNTKILMTMALMCVVLLTGCQEEQMSDPNAIDKSEVNRKIVDTYSDLAIQNAIVAQHTLYPYHFAANSADLNELGQRDLRVLIEHYKVNPGSIAIHQGPVDGILYQARAHGVYNQLVDAGIPKNKIDINDGMPGGNGMPSSTVIEILERSKQISNQQQSETMEVKF